jgi:NADH-quinone oxidoreductase subunit L
MDFFSSLWLIPLLPLLGAVINGVIGKRLPKPVVASIGAGTVALSFAISLGAFLQMLRLPEADLPVIHNYFVWIQAGNFHANFGFLLDHLSGLMILIVTGVGFLIHVYSSGYMHDDSGFYRFFAYLNLFMFSMLTLVLANNYLLMFVGWEGVGLCSYLLIGFWFGKKSATDAGKKAFIVNRIGDFGFLLGMFFLFSSGGSLNYERLFAVAPHVFVLGSTLITTATLLLFLGATGKSAQIPLYVWLPDAMEGPTPVSALIHAATMVTAGVYMVARLGALYELSETTMWIVAAVGGMTAFVAATIAIVQNDIKKVLAYSTVSQLGYMFLACGVGAFGAGVFHLVTHAFFKALMFLGSGSVIHGLSGEQDMRQMGGLRTRMPWTFRTFTAGWLAIIGFPFFSGYFSKEEILMAAFAHNRFLFAMALLTAGLTAFYMSRLFFLTFTGEYRGNLEKVPADHAAPDAHGHHDAHAADHKADDHGAGHGHGGIHESPAVMLIPLLLLAIGAVFGGLIPVPHFVEPAIRAEAHFAELGWMKFAAGGIAALGVWFAYLMYAGALREAPAKIAAKYAGVKDLLDAKWGFDDAYDSFVRNGMNGVVDISERVLWKKVDAGWIDGVVNGLGQMTNDFAQGGKLLQSGLVRGSALSILAGAVALLSAILWANG